MKNIKNFSLCRLEVDIVHPDTPTGRLGTKSFSPREQDARNNMRPSFSQIEKAMNKIVPNVNANHSVSLRVPMEEPGYQITKTYFSGNIDNSFKKNMESKFKNFSKRNNYILDFNEMPLGSKAYKFKTSLSYEVVFR